jgi:hypothetical protein
MLHPTRHLSRIERRHEEREPMTLVRPGDRRNPGHWVARGITRRLTPARLEGCSLLKFRRLNTVSLGECRSARLTTHFFCASQSLRMDGNHFWGICWEGQALGNSSKKWKRRCCRQSAPRRRSRRYTGCLTKLGKLWPDEGVEDNPST